MALTKSGAAVMGWGIKEWEFPGGGGEGAGGGGGAEFAGGSF